MQNLKIMNRLDAHLSEKFNGLFVIAAKKFQFPYRVTDRLREFNCRVASLK